MPRLLIEFHERRPPQAYNLVLAVVIADFSWQEHHGACLANQE
jgi:hypothetical protein